MVFWGWFLSSASVASFASVTYPGKIWNKARGTEEYENLIIQDSSSPFLLREILYCQSNLFSSSSTQAPPDPNSSSSSNQPHSGNVQPPNPGLINHVFLVVDNVMVSPDNQVGLFQVETREHMDLKEYLDREHFFHAEKFHKHDSKEAQIVIQKIPNPDAYKHCILTSFKCKDTPLGLREMMRILEDHDPDYRILDKNCWEYAVERTKKLLLKCHEKTGDGYFTEMAAGVGFHVWKEHLKMVIKLSPNVIAKVVDEMQSGASKSDSELVKLAGNVVKFLELLQSSSDLVSRVSKKFSNPEEVVLQLISIYFKQQRLNIPFNLLRSILKVSMSGIV